MTVSDADTAKVEGPQATDKILYKEGEAEGEETMSIRV